MFGSQIIKDSVSQVVVDTVHSAHSLMNEEQGFNFAEVLEHLKNSRTVELPVLELWGITLDLSPTKHSIFLIIGAVLLSIAAIYTARTYKKSSIPHGFANLMEFLIVFVRDEIILPNLGRNGFKYAPYLLTTFFYILIMNLLGLVPFGATATSNIMVTAGLAIIAFFMIQISAIRAQGIKHYLAHLTGGMPWFLWIIMIPVEILGLFTKPFSLCMRLFANMTGGHIVIISLLGMILMFRSIFVAPFPLLFIVGIYLLELFVAFLQAYIFTMLTALFIGVGMQVKEGHSH